MSTEKLKGLEPEVEGGGGIGDVDGADAAVGEVLLGEEVGASVGGGDELVGGDGLAVADGAEGGEVVAALLCGGLEELVVELGAAFEQLLVLGVGGEEHVGEGESLASPVGDEALLEVLDGVDVVVGEHDAGGGGCAGGDGEGLGDGDGVAAAAGGGEDSGVGEFVAAGERAVADDGVAAVVLLGDGGVEAVVGAEGEVEVSPFDAVVVPGAREHLGMGGGLGEELEASAAVSSGDGLVSGAVDAEVTGEVEFDGDVVGLAVVGGGGPVEVGDGP